MKTQHLSKTILIISVVVLMLGSSQCKKPVTAPRPSSPPSPVSPTERELADQRFFKGDYKAAAEGYGSYLERNPEAEDSDTVQFHLAISYAFLDDPSHDLTRTTALLSEIVNKPGSSHLAEAKLILRLVAENRGLREDSSLKDREIKQLQAALQGFEERETRRWELGFADQNFAKGDYNAAVMAYSRYLENYPDGEDRDRAVFHLAISHALPDSPMYDPERAEELFRELVRDPNSTHRPDAERILSLTAQIKQLRTESSEKSQAIQRLAVELEKLKAIDLKTQPADEPH